MSNIEFGICWHQASKKQIEDILRILLISRDLYADRKLLELYRAQVQKQFRRMFEEVSGTGVRRYGMTLVIPSRPQAPGPRDPATTHPTNIVTRY